MALGQEYTWPPKTNPFPVFEKQSLWGGPSGENNIPMQKWGTFPWDLVGGSEATDLEHCRMPSSQEQSFLFHLNTSLGTNVHPPHPSSLWIPEDPRPAPSTPSKTSLFGKFKASRSPLGVFPPCNYEQMSWFQTFRRHKQGLLLNLF